MFTQEHLEKSTEYFSHMLYDSDDGAVARNYLESRGLPLERLREYEVGLCPADLLYPSSNELFLDGRCWFIRGRIVVPIRDQHGRILAFAGRIVEDLEPTVREVLAEQLGENEVKLEELMTKWRKSKWINEMYKKKRYVFGLDRAKRPAFDRGNLILVEGYLDSIVMSMSGYENVVAVQGSNFSKVQVALIKRYADHVTICMDTDANESGQKAAERIAKLLEAMGMTHCLVKLPEGIDPDDMLLKGGFEAEKFRWALDEAANAEVRAGTTIDLTNPRIETAVLARLASKTE